MKFSIRDLFLVTMIVAILVAWWVDHRRRLPTTLTRTEVERLESYNTHLEGCIDSVDRQLAEYGLQLEERDSSQGPGRPRIVRFNVVPLPTSSAPAPNPSKP